jgi:hypothetical protein
MTNKKFPTLSNSHRDLLKRIMDYFSSNSIRSPWRTDYIVLRMSQQGTNEYSDTIFIPNYNNADTLDFYSPFKCNAFASEAVKIIPGAYDYRLATRFGLVYGQQMEPVYYENTILNSTKTDRGDNRLIGINLIAHPLHSLIPLLTPISNASKGSIMIHPSAHGLLKQNFKNRHSIFKLYVIDIDLLL